MASVLADGNRHGQPRALPGHDAGGRDIERARHGHGYRGQQRPLPADRPAGRARFQGSRRRRLRVRRARKAGRSTVPQIVRRRRRLRGRHRPERARRPASARRAGPDRRRPCLGRVRIDARIRKVAHDPLSQCRSQFRRGLAGGGQHGRSGRRRHQPRPLRPGREHGVGCHPRRFAAHPRRARGRHQVSRRHRQSHGQQLPARQHRWRADLERGDRRHPPGRYAGRGPAGKQPGARRPDGPANGGRSDTARDRRHRGAQHQRNLRGGLRRLAQEYADREHELLRRQPRHPGHRTGHRPGRNEVQRRRLAGAVGPARHQRPRCRQPLPGIGRTARPPTAPDHQRRRERHAGRGRRRRNRGPERLAHGPPRCRTDLRRLGAARHAAAPTGARPQSRRVDGPGDPHGPACGARPECHLAAGRAAIRADRRQLGGLAGRGDPEPDARGAGRYDRGGRAARARLPGLDAKRPGGPAGLPGLARDGGARRPAARRYHRRCVQPGRHGHRRPDSRRGPA
ncbi:Uncharacterised protein [Bordetella pertussis]|nr:Uncharacterised protein [Bordetella pertussis]CPJ53200.1 Uncharacterised protein [Bordetella pertussis]CPM59001.1 Uncharacterised protein [Bordetella pertussis]CPN54283.1 Uncharacterised protein [Bordetella pertussis]CPO10686.1 Uncharacterised protein [Bordetella pertussis]